jgi:hypothetical protein
MRRVVLLLGTAAALLIVSAAPAVASHAATTQEVAELQAAAEHTLGPIGYLREVLIASRDSNWASATAADAPVTVKIFFRRLGNRWREVSASSGCVNGRTLGMPRGVGRELGTCQIP